MRGQVLQSPDVILNPYRFAAAGNGLLNGLLHWWNLDETSGNAIAQAGGVDLIDTNTVGYAAGAAPDGGNARSFVRTNSERFSASAGSVLNSGSAISFSIWTDVNADTVNQGVFGHNAPNGYTYFQFTTAEYPYMWFDSANTMAHLVAATGWHHWVITSTGPGGSDVMYKDGTQVDTGTAGWEPGSAIFYLGAAQGGTNYFNGEMASFGIWDRVLDSDDVAALYNSGVNLRYADLTS